MREPRGRGRGQSPGTGNDLQADTVKPVTVWPEEQRPRPAGAVPGAGARGGAVEETHRPPREFRRPTVPQLGWCTHSGLPTGPRRTQDLALHATKFEHFLKINPSFVEEYMLSSFSNSQFESDQMKWIKRIHLYFYFVYVTLT